MEDFERIHEAAQSALLRSSSVKAALGSSIICDKPFSSSMSSIDTDGKQLKMISLTFEVAGDAAAGRASVSAVIDKDANVTLKNLNVSVPGGKVISVNVDETGRRKGPVIDV